MIARFEPWPRSSAVQAHRSAGRFEFWTDNVLLTLPPFSGLGGGIDNHDIIEFWGTVKGAYNYQTAIGGQNTVPEIDVR
jgi:hypothetical protein